MPFQKLTERKATSRTPQVVTMVVDDSGSMMDNGKCTQATQGVKDLLMTIQSGNQGATGSRFVVSVAKFGTDVVELARSARPEEVDLTKMVFAADTGGTEMAKGLEWAITATTEAMGKCASVPNYIAEGAPNPVVFFFSDGANTGRDIVASAKALKGISFPGGRVDVVAVGVGMSASEFATMEHVASAPELAKNIDPADLADFLAAVGATLQKGEKTEDLLKEF